MTYPPQQPGNWSDPSWPQQPYDPTSGAPGYVDPSSPVAYPPQMPAQPYGAYGYGAPIVMAAPTNGLSIASLVVSLVGLLMLSCYGVGALIAIVGAILGHVGRKQIRERGEGGDGLALAGIIVGWIATGIGVVIVGIVVVAIFVTAAASPSYTP